MDAFISQLFLFVSGLSEACKLAVFCAICFYYQEASIGADCTQNCYSHFNAVQSLSLQGGISVFCNITSQIKVVTCNVNIALFFLVFFKEGVLV